MPTEDDVVETVGTGSPFAETVTEPEATSLAFAPIWVNYDSLPAHSPVSGISMRSFTGGQLMLNWVAFQPHQVVPRHQHPHEQAGIMLQGSLTLTIGDETRQVTPGDGYAIPPHLPHGAVAGPDGCLVLDVFTPPREDYRLPSED